MSDQEHGTILAVGIPEDGLPQESHWLTFAPTGRDAVELLRMLRFDLVVTADHLSDMPVWQFVQRMKSAWPWQKWALVAGQLNERDEITARTLGVMHILEANTDWLTVQNLAEEIHSRSVRSAEANAALRSNPLRAAAKA